MARTKIELETEFVSGKRMVSVADQRDIARWEVQDEAQLERPPAITRLRFLAYSALVRQQQFSGSWSDFQEQALEVGAYMPERAESKAEQEDEQGLDPGRMGVSASA
jgi:hypothetical protein